MAFNESLIPPGLVAVVEDEGLNLLEQKLGLTYAQAAAYFTESVSENPQFTQDETIADVVGKGEHGLRDGELPITLGSAVDVLWPVIKPYWAAVVAAAVAGGAYVPASTAGGA
jgi:hypothetical protein